MNTQHVELNIQGDNAPLWEQVPVETVGAIESSLIDQGDLGDGETVEDGFDGA